jgi:hypothetical protein
VTVLFLFSMLLSCGEGTVKETDNDENNQETPDDSKENGNEDKDDSEEKESVCGNGVVDNGEECDGGAANCVDISDQFTGGVAICNSDCKWDRSTCVKDEDSDDSDDPDDNGEIENPDDDNGEEEEEEDPDCQNSFEVVKGDYASYSKGCLYNMQVGSNPFDLYIPAAPKDQKMFVAIYMQGGKVAKEHYSNHSKLLSSYGIIVAIPKNDKTLEGANMTENKVFNAVWDYIKDESSKSESPLYNIVEHSKVAVMGHSNGGMAALGIIQNKCEMPTCGMFENYESPSEVAAGILYGTNTRNPMTGAIGEVNTRDIPTMFIQGTVDGMAKLEDTLKTLDKTTGTPVVLVSLEGANHYGITDTNNPDGANKDNNAPTIDQGVANETIARWTAMYIKAHLSNDSEADNYVYDGVGESEDPNVEVDLY